MYYKKVRLQYMRSSQDPSCLRMSLVIQIVRKNDKKLRMLPGGRNFMADVAGAVPIERFLFKICGTFPISSSSIWNKE
jgi:hypothetical protein